MSVERKEYQETQVFRSVSPVRNTRSSTQNVSQFDNNLDNLLQDLQSSVPANNSYSSTYKETKTVNGYDSSKNNSLNRFANLKASNPVTEYSSDDAYNYTSPDGTKSVKSYKKESYSYKGGDTSDKFRGDFKINELDTLLDDLQQVKNSSYGKESYNSFGAEPGFGSKIVEREQRTEGGGSYTKEYSEETYGRTLRQSSPSPTRSNTSTLSKQTKVSNVHSYPLEVNETITPDINADLLANLDPNVPTGGNTKVTTTIKTYTYELPGAGGTTTNTENLSYSLNESQTTPSKSFVYNKAENTSSNKQSTVKYGGEDSKWNFEERYFKESVSSQPPATQPVNISVKFQTHTETTKDVTNGYDEAVSSMQPGPFPTDDDSTAVKMVEEVIAKIEEKFPVSSYNASFVQQEVEIIEEKVEPVVEKVEPPQLQKQIEVPKKEEPKTKNVSGPPVYYPPGEMFAKKETTAMHQSNGGMIAHEKEKFEYKSKEKSKTKGGTKAAVIPVCLPLCCGLPCTIL